MEWVKVVDEPDFVRFNHRPHIAAGVACESCHGDVSSMSYAQEVYNLNMGFCLSCHRAQDPAIVARPRELRHLSLLTEVRDPDGGVYLHRPRHWLDAWHPVR